MGSYIGCSEAHHYTYGDTLKRPAAQHGHSATPTTDFRNFLRLPLELRERVYEEYFRSEPALQVLDVSQTRPDDAPDLCRTIPEAIPAYISNTVIKIDGRTTVNALPSLRDIENLADGLEKVDRGFESVRELHFDDFALSWGTAGTATQTKDPRSHQHILFIQRFPGLNSVRLEVASFFALPVFRRRGDHWGQSDALTFGEMLAFYGLEGLFECETFETMLAFYGLEGLFECKALCRIEFVYSGYNAMQAYVGDIYRARNGLAEILMGEVMEWLSKEFKRRNNQTVDVWRIPA